MEHVLVATLLKMMCRGGSNNLRMAEHTNGVSAALFIQHIPPLLHGLDKRKRSSKVPLSPSPPCTTQPIVWPRKKIIQEVASSPPPPPPPTMNYKVHSLSIFMANPFSFSRAVFFLRETSNPNHPGSKDFLDFIARAVAAKNFFLAMHTPFIFVHLRALCVVRIKMNMCICFSPCMGPCKISIAIVGKISIGLTSLANYDRHASDGFKGGDPLNPRTLITGC